MPAYLKHGDITKIEVDVIVNAANPGLGGGGGVDGAIHRVGGPTIMEECRKIGGCATGQAVITNAGNLPSKKVIHAVGPIWYGGSNNENDLLKSAYMNSLNLAIENNLKSIAFPNISTGVYGFPKMEAATIAIKVVKLFLKTHPVIDIYFVCFDDENYSLYQELLHKL